MKKRNGPIGEQLLSRTEVAEKLAISIDSVKRMEKKGQLKPIRLNSRVTRYRLSDVDGMMTEYEVGGAR